MRGVTKILILFVVATLCSSIYAKPVLVTVELNNQKQIQFWKNYDYPTYEFIDNTAIAEIGDSQVPILNQQGFSYQIIDEFPWSENYFVSTVPEDLKRALPGKIIWQKGEICLIKVPQHRLLDLFRFRLKFQPFKRTILPDRFWEQIITKKVSMPIQWDPFIQGVVDQVNTDSITSYIQRLQDFRTRLMLTDSSYAASEWLRQKFNSWGYTAEFDSFYYGGWPGPGYERNVIATVNGTVNPSKIFIIGGHFDAIFWADTSIAQFFAPGADDNASGTSAAIEAARIFSNYSWDPTIKFVGWAAEELGLIGSYHYADNADSLGLDIGGVVNLDMVGYMDNADLDCIIQRKSGAPTWLSDLFEQAAQTYVPLLLVCPTTSSGGSDWYPFANLGFPSVGAAERVGSHYNPYYHDTTDLLSTLSPELYTNITKAAVATIAILGVTPDEVKDVAVQDMGDGNRLVMNWSANSELDVVGYKVYWGLTSEVYTDTHLVSGIANTTDTLTGLMTDSTYYIVVRARDSDGHESFQATEVIGAPMIMPTAPEGVTAMPIISGIRIDWQPNPELDLAGYRVYRRINENPTYDSLNIILLPDTTFTNAPLSGADKYYYAVRAFDDDGNASAMSEEAYGRPITLDQGIIIVDETRNWTSGNYPHDTTQDNFYRYILDGFTFDEYEYGSSAEKPVLADLVPYSTVVWHADDYIGFLASDNIEDLETYLDYGGKLWFVGWKPTGNLRNNPGYPVDFNPGSFVYDYLKISHAELSTSSDSFQSTNGLLGYPDIDIDPNKVPLPVWGGYLRYIEALTSVSPAEDIYTIDMLNNSSPFEGLVCGIRYLGQDFKTVFFGFPLYFMEQEQARAAAINVMIDFGEPGVEEQPDDNIVIREFKLDHTMPTVFRGNIRIRFSSPDQRKVTIKLYDVVGRAVKTVFDDKAETGINEVLVTPQDLPTGVYFVNLVTQNYRETMKVLLLK